MRDIDLFDLLGLATPMAAMKSISVGGAGLHLSPEMMAAGLLGGLLLLVLYVFKG
jgi:hypothetical protein